MAASVRVFFEHPSYVFVVHIQVIGILPFFDTAPCALSQTPLIKCTGLFTY